MYQGGLKTFREVVPIREFHFFCYKLRKNGTTYFNNVPGEGGLSDCELL